MVVYIVLWLHYVGGFYTRSKRTYGSHTTSPLLENLGNMTYKDRYRIHFWKVTNENTHTL